MHADDVEGDVAPVIPLFGGSARRDAESAGAHGGRRRFPVRRLPAASEAVELPSAEMGSVTTGDAGSPADGGGSSADVREAGDGTAGDPEAWHTTWRGLGREPGVRAAPRLETVERGGMRFVELPEGERPVAGAASGEPDADDVVERAETKLLRSLGSRGLSVSEARAKLRRQEVPTEAIDDVIDRLGATGALDDDALAEQIVHQRSTHRGEGRRAIAQSLAKRGIPRDTIDRIVAELPDDDYERALEFAKGRARQLARYDDETALRRLVGQLSRRGYGGLAISVARRAIDEQTTPSHRVRFE